MKLFLTTHRSKLVLSTVSLKWSGHVHPPPLLLQTWRLLISFVCVCDGAWDLESREETFSRNRAAPVLRLPSSIPAAAQYLMQCAQATHGGNDKGKLGFLWITVIFGDLFCETTSDTCACTQSSSVSALTSIYNNITDPFQLQWAQITQKS